MKYDNNVELRNKICVAMDGICNIKKKIEVDNSMHDSSVVYVVFDIFSGAVVGFIVSLIYRYIFGYNVIAMVICMTFGLCSGVYLALMKLFKN